MGKPPSGLETGNVIWAGDYDHCLEVAAPAINISVRVGPFRYHHPASYNGQYCMATIIKKGDPPVSVLSAFCGVCGRIQKSRVLATGTSRISTGRPHHRDLRTGSVYG